jgi:hypothetical protein
MPELELDSMIGVRSNQFSIIYESLRDVFLGKLV